ncbi:hypothetical protein H5410_025598 [Solanum commersonii]|uniref:Uncharacterized protein n=1 Tax=Solanum commersonii TaxID=4109 RepID=A0A9J5YUN6_SOLCO|nr:hypothetical protein H5410_025598 [Solanum commersonii]
MFVASTPDAVEFRKNIRAYNSIFAFTSFGVNLDKELASKKRVKADGIGNKKRQRLPHERSAHSPIITNDIPTFISVMQY